MRDIPVGNGSLLVNFDEKYQIRDIYFPHVGQENHTEGFPFRFGVWADGEFSWVFSDDWERILKYLQETLVTDVVLTNKNLDIKIVCHDTVASHDNIYLRRVCVSNLRDTTREIRIFLHHDFRIYENEVGDTAFYDPENFALVHYKKHRYFLINTEPHFDSFSTGRKAFRDHEGTWRDAEDGELHGGAITEGSVDSTIGNYFSLEPNGRQEFYYWIAAGTTHDEVAKLNRLVLDRTPEKYLAYTQNYWRAWVNKNDIDFGGLSPSIIDLYKRSLLIMSTQIDDGGAILAANDSDVTERATDHYSYLWTRDGAFVANALDIAGYPEITRAFFNFCNRIAHPNGYFMQKYNPDGTVASGWHAAWDIRGKRQLVPIQEDETALIIWALWQHYERYRDIDFAHKLYVDLIADCARFMVEFRNSVTKLPLPSWNLWEDRRGIHTFTCSTVVAGLRAAAKFASLFGEENRAAEYDTAADEIVKAMAEHLYSNELGRFLRSLQVDGDDGLTPDTTIDASLFATFYFGCFDIDDPRVRGTIRAIENNLLNGTEFGGIARFENDAYMRTADKSPSNPWIITTLWLAEYYIAAAKTRVELGKALEILAWTVDRALPSGVLAEQIEPLTGAPRSVSPLTWSHSTFIAAVNSYLSRQKELDS
ncbi:MAG: glycoside hydrolase family 15 protein [Pyrinomonadaceae bacterium]